MKNCQNKNAFTLAETLITVLILGILAAILVPNLIKNQVENANRTKVKKAMAAYEKAINMMIIENDIKSTEALRELGQDNCQYIREYFKTVQDGSNNCIFKTTDRVWWDITDITNPLISLKDEITGSNVTAIANNALSLNADTTSFALIGRFDDIGTLRVNDNAYEQGLSNNLTNQAYMIKLWHFVNNNYNFSSTEQFRVCKVDGETKCTISLNGAEITYTRVTTTNDSTININCLYNRNNSPKFNCDGYTSFAQKGEYWISDNLGKLTESEAKDRTGSICGYSGCTNDGDYYEAAKRKCQNSGGHLASLAELKIAHSKLFKPGACTYFWASEEYTYNDAYFMSFCTGQYGVNKQGKAEKGYNVICIGED